MRSLFARKKPDVIHDEKHSHAVAGSIRQKFIRVFLWLGIVPLAVITVSALYFLNVSRERNIEEVEVLLARQKAEEIERFIEDTLASFEIVVPYEDKAPIADGFNGGTLSLSATEAIECGSGYNYICDNQSFILQGLLDSNKYLSEVAFFNTLSLPGKSVALGQETKRLICAERSKDTFKCERQIVPSDCAVAHSSAEPEDCEYYSLYPNSDTYEAIVSGRQYIGLPYKTQSGYFVTIATPVRNKNGDIIAGLRGELSLKSYVKIFASSRLGTTGYAYLIDDKAMPIVATVGLALPVGTPVDNEMTRRLGGPDASDTNALTGIIYTNIFGNTVVGTARSLSDLGLTVVVEWPYADAYNIVYTIVNQAVLFSLIVLLAIVLVSRVLAHQFTKPIAALQFAASRIGKGDFEPISEMRTGDELEFLAHSINEMAKDLKGLDELKKRALQSQLLELSLAKEKELVELKDSFLDTASHQLRTPISAIRWQLELLEGETMADSAKELIKGAEEHIEFLSEISSDLINAASYGVGYVVKNIGEVSLTKVIAEVTNHFSAQIAQLKLVLDVVPPPQDMLVAGSYPAIRVLFENIIGNAVRYTKEGGHITITTIVHADAIEIRVSDTGIGIPPEEHKMIFAQFFRATNAIETRNVGTGLGLYIAKNIVDGHGGSIWFTSEIGKGSTFFVKFPVKTATPSRQASPSQPA